MEMGKATGQMEVIRHVLVRARKHSVTLGEAVWLEKNWPISTYLASLAGRIELMISEKKTSARFGGLRKKGDLSISFLKHCTMESGPFSGIYDLKRKSR